MYWRWIWLAKRRRLLLLRTAFLSSSACLSAAETPGYPPDLMRSGIPQVKKFVNMANCRFAAEFVSFLGHEVGVDGLRPSPEKVRTVAEFSPPTSVTQLRSFLSLVSFYRRFIPGFVMVAFPLTKLLNASKWRWRE
jgi:hypothetical protein